MFIGINCVPFHLNISRFAESTEMVGDRMLSKIEGYNKLSHQNELSKHICINFYLLF